MVLVDTSVWVSHLRVGNARLAALLDDAMVVCHPLVIGELACGNLRSRGEVLSLLQALPTAQQAEHHEVLQFIETHRLMGRGIGYSDAHLLTSAVLTGIPLWTLDKRLASVATTLGVGSPG